MQNPADFTLAKKFAATHPRHVSLISTNKSARESSPLSLLNSCKRLQATARCDIVRVSHSCVLVTATMANAPGAAR